MRQMLTVCTLKGRERGGERGGTGGTHGWRGVSIKQTKYLLTSVGGLVPNALNWTVRE